MPIPVVTVLVTGASIDKQVSIDYLASAAGPDASIACSVSSPE